MDQPCRRIVVAAICCIGLRTLLGAPAELVPNRGFEDGIEGWVPGFGPHRPGAEHWADWAGKVDRLDRDAFEGRSCLRLNAVGREHEIDACSKRFEAKPKQAYVLDSRVRHLAGPGRYKVVIDWCDAAGKHISYDNDWRGAGQPRRYISHGGLFWSPDNAAQANILVGVAAGNAFLFDAISLIAVPTKPSDLRDVPDGVGQARYVGPETVAANSFATFKIIYKAGAEGLPLGKTITFRRSNPDPRWSPVQTDDPAAPGYTTAKASNGTRLGVHPGAQLRAPSITRIAIMGPSLGPGDTVEITYGDRSRAGPGAKVQPVAEGNVMFWVGVDGDADGRTLDVPDLDGFSIVPSEPDHVALIPPYGTEVGRKTNVRVEIRDSGENVVPSFRGRIELRPDNGQTLSVRDATRHAFVCRFTRPGVHTLTVRAGPMSAEKTVFVSRPLPPLPRPSVDVTTWGNGLLIHNKHVCLALPANAQGFGYGVLFAHNGGRYRRVATLPNLGELRLPGKRMPLYAGTVADVENGLRLSGTTPGWQVQATLRLRPGDRHVSLAVEVAPERDAELLAFYGPTLYVGDGEFGRGKNTALLPGLEYLEGDERSSDTVGVIPPYHERWNPHPYKITVPMMAVAHDGLCGAMFWDPHQQYDGEHRYPSVRFASPNRLDRQDNHLLALFVPSVLDGLSENAGQLDKPMAVPAGTRLSLSADLVALGDAEDVTAATAYWHEQNGLPRFPQRVRSWAQEKELILRAYVDAAWQEDEGGWWNTIVDHGPPRYNPHFAVSMWHYLRTNRATPLRAKIEHQLETVAKRGDLRGFEFSFLGGNPVRALVGREDQALAAASAQATDGSWCYRPHTGRSPSIFSQAHAKAIGRGGEVCCGTCLNVLSGLFRTARMTGDPAALQAGLKGLRFLEEQDYRRPQGSENWEVPLECPNLRAAALAVDSYLDAHLLTGERRHLDKARYWALTGLPFIYLWQAHDRDIMPYASVSVMGTTFWTGLWFGRPVQWVGLVYAEAIRRLARYDSTVDWLKLAEGITLSAMQQQMGRVEPRRNRIGFYTDNYCVVTKNICQWYLSPTGIERMVDFFTGCGPWVDTEVVRIGGKTVHINSAARIEDARFSEQSLSFALAGTEGLSHGVVICGLSCPRSVSVAGAEVSRGNTLGVREPVWLFDEVTGFIGVKVDQRTPRVPIVVTGCHPTARALQRIGASLTNGGFERGLHGWAGSPAGEVSVRGKAHTGRSCLLLDARTHGPEVQAHSRRFRVKGGRVYRLTSYVKGVAGKAGFKVTIDWLGPQHIRYDNDWKGDDPVPEWTLHGGTFRAPDNATMARIILGCRAGSCYLFDDVSLTEEP